MKEMIERLKKAGKKLELKPGASQSLIDLSETVLNRVIPDDYVQMAVNSFRQEPFFTG